MGWKKYWSAANADKLDEKIDSWNGRALLRGDTCAG